MCVCVYWRNIGEETEQIHHSNIEEKHKKGIAVHTWKTQHKVDWEAATVKQVERHFKQRRIIEFTSKTCRKSPLPLTVGGPLSSVWQPLICSP